MTAKVTSLILAVISIMSVGCVATQGDVSSVYARQTRLEGKMERLSSQVDAISQKESTATGSDVELKEKVYRLEANMKELSQAYSKLQAKVNQQSLGTPPPVSESGSQMSAPSEAASVNTEDAIFNEGYTELSEGNYDNSRAKFKEFLSKYPKSQKSSDATYWIAESYYREGQFEESILEYQKFIDTYPKDRRVPLSYLKQGMSLVEIGKKEEAKLFFQTLIDKYPNSDEAKTAKEKISELAVKH
ncbi:MAG: tol-pal system protein YbgF [Thermodesulfobacteriota bacterium]